MNCKDNKCLYFGGCSIKRTAENCSRLNEIKYLKKLKARDKKPKEKSN